MCNNRHFAVIAANYELAKALQCGAAACSKLLAAFAARRGNLLAGIKPVVKIRVALEFCRGFTFKFTKADFAQIIDTNLLDAGI